MYTKIVIYQYSLYSDANLFYLIGGGTVLMYNVNRIFLY